MKGVPGLLVALALGIAGGLANWFYMAQKAKSMDMVQFIAVKGGIKAGEVFRADQLDRVPVPQLYAVRLKESAPLFADASIVVGSPAFRDFRDGEIILTQDLLTPAGFDLKKDLGPNDDVIWVTVDARGFVPSFLSGGDEVSFIVPKLGSGRPIPVESNGGARVASETELVGPFHILALGSRRGDYARTKAAGYAQVQENILAVRVERVSETELEPKAQLLLERLRLSNNQALGLVMHATKKKEAPRKVGGR